MAHPLKLTLSFKDWERERFFFDLIFKKISHIKLFQIELEFERKSFFLFLEEMRNIVINAFQRSVSIDDTALLSHVPHLKNYEIIFDFPFYVDLKTLRGIIEDFSKSGSPNYTLSYFLTAKNIPQFKELIDFALHFGTKKFIIPNPDLVNHKSLISSCFLRPSDLDKIYFLKDCATHITLQVHDYFLARFLGLRDAALFKGCQAGTYMGYIQNGIVYPCKSIPITLGSLFDENFDKIWERAPMLLKEVTMPKMCKICERNNDCLLGCPGTAFYLNNGEKDPLCEKDVNVL